MQRSNAFGLSVVVALTVVTWIPRLSGPIDLRWDAAAYYLLATGLSTGEGYRYLNEPGEVTAVAWPPLLPAFVAVHQWILQTADPVTVGRALRWSFFALSLLYSLLTYTFLRALFSTSLAVAGSALVILNVTTIWLSDRLYADLPFAIAVTASMLFMMRKPESELRTFTAATSAFLLRTAGIAVLLAWVADAVLSRTWSAVLRRSALAVIPVIAWQGYVYQVERTPSYTNPPYAYARADYSLYNVSYVRNMMLRDPTRPELGRSTLWELPQRMLSNASKATFHLGESVSLLDRDWAALMEAIKERPVGKFVPWRLIPVSLIAFGVAVLFGAVLIARSVHRRIAVTMAAYLVLLALLPTDYHWPRYLAGISPLIIACFLFCLTAAAGAIRQRGRTPVLALIEHVPAAVFVAALTLEIVNLTWYYRFDLREVTHRWGESTTTYYMFSYDDGFSAFDDGVDWIAQHAESTDVVVASIPHWVFLRTGRTAVMPPLERDAQHARALLASANARYVLVDRAGFSPAHVYAAPAVDGSAEYVRVYSHTSGLLDIYAAR